MVACGGGGGGIGSPELPAPVAPSPPVAPLKVSATSYENAKEINIPPINYPPIANTTRAVADFHQMGENSVFLATHEYDFTKPSTYDKKGRFLFFKRSPVGEWMEDTDLLKNSEGCLHARKAIVADFNQDGRPDVFVACHGLDVKPFPGEKQALILSSADGGYKTTWLPYVAFGHGAAAADINGDGYPDVILTDSTENGVSLLINQKDGTFDRRFDLLPPALLRKIFFTAEFFDVDGDGRLDLFLAGHNWVDSGSCECVTDPMVLINDGSGSFARSKSLTLPPVEGNGVALDVVYKNSNFYILRTSGGVGIPFYSGTVVQKVNYPSLASSVIFSSPGGSMGAFAPPFAGGWTPWIIPFSGNIRPDAVVDGFDFSMPY